MPKKKFTKRGKSDDSGNEGDDEQEGVETQTTTAAANRYRRNTAPSSALCTSTGQELLTYKRITSIVPLSVRIAANNVQRSLSLTIFGITNAETVEEIFPNWLNKAFIGSENDPTYRPYDLNMPPILMRRPAAHYQMDSPITEHGKICAALIARGILLANYRPTAIFTSPELRCIETARSMQRVFHIDNCALYVEPSLAEYSRFRGDAQKCWLTFARLQQEGILSMRRTYMPLLRTNQLARSETPQEFVRRIQRFYQLIIMKFSGKCVIIVSNITGIFVLNDGTATLPWHLQAPHGYMNTCHLCSIEVTPDGKIEPIENPILPLTRTLFDVHKAPRKLHFLFLHSLLYHLQR